MEFLFWKLFTICQKKCKFQFFSYKSLIEHTVRLTGTRRCLSCLHLYQVIRYTKELYFCSLAFFNNFLVAVAVVVCLSSPLISSGRCNQQVKGSYNNKCLVNLCTFFLPLQNNKPKFVLPGERLYI